MKSGGVAISAGVRRRSHSKREMSFWSKMAISPSRIRVGTSRARIAAAMSW